MFLELQKETEFKRVYFDVLKYRLSFGSLELEGINGDLAEVTQSMKIFNQLNAINYIFSQSDDELGHFEFTNLLCEVANQVSGGEVSNFRTGPAHVIGSMVERSKHQMIRNNLWYLIDNYNYMIANAKSDRELYEIEARFHIQFLHIHPFGDANGRTARIFLTYNLARNNLAPCIITKERKAEYCNYIEKSDYKGLGKMFEELSKKELDIMIALYKELDSHGRIESNQMTTNQEKAYQRIIKY